VEVIEQPRRLKYYLHSPWTETTDKYLISNWGKKGVRDIANFIGVTKSSAAGRAMRLGLKRLQAPRFKGLTNGPRKRPAPKLVRDKPPRLPTKAATDLAPDQSNCAISLIEAKPHQCRWPLDEPTAAMMVCGETKCEGSSYCIRHHNIAYRKNYVVDEQDKIRRHHHWKKVCVAKVTQFLSEEANT
jgi:hypothetical protein